MKKLTKSNFKVKSLVLLLGLTSLTQGYCINIASLGSVGTVFSNPEYSNPQHLLLYGQAPYHDSQPYLEANIINYTFLGSNLMNAFYNNAITVGIESIYGINFFEEGAMGYPIPSITEQDNFAYYQYVLNEGVVNSSRSLNGVSLNVSTQSPNNLVSQPSIKSIQEVEPADSNDNDMPIYHIVVNSGYGVQDSTANSTVASAYYFNAYDSSPFDSSSLGGSVVEPLSVIPDPNDSTDYGLSQADFYYHGDLKNIGIYQNINYFPQQDNYSSGMYSGSDTENLSKATPPTPPSGASGIPAKGDLAIKVFPVSEDTATMADPIYANGMNQAAFTVQILLNGSPISPSDSQYGWLYSLLYFSDATTGNIITNFAQNNGSEAITMNQGPYTEAIIGNGVAAPSALKNSDSNSETFYYSNTAAGDYNIIANLEAPVSGGGSSFAFSSYLTFQVENNSKLSATNASFPSSNSTSSGLMSFSNSIQSASSDSPATYLNLDNPAHPIYVGFIRYASVSAYNYYETNSSSSLFAVNLNGPSYNIKGSTLDFSYNYQKLGLDATYPNEMAIDVVDDYGNFYQTAGYGD